MLLALLFGSLEGEPFQLLKTRRFLLILFTIVYNSPLVIGNSFVTSLLIYDPLGLKSYYSLVYGKGFSQSLVLGWAICFPFPLSIYLCFSSEKKVKWNKNSETYCGIRWCQMSTSKQDFGWCKNQKKFGRRRSFWCNILKLKDTFVKYFSIKISNGACLRQKAIVRWVKKGGWLCTTFFHKLSLSLNCKLAENKAAITSLEVENGQVVDGDEVVEEGILSFLRLCLGVLLVWLKACSFQICLVCEKHS